MREEKTKLNLGAGPSPMPGYVNLDIKEGTDIGSLNVDDGSVDEIRASHVLEHVSWTKTPEILQHWFAKLKPGGLVKIAVPDFNWIVEQFTAGPTSVPVEGYIMGGHIDSDDRHGAIFNYDKLANLLRQCGFEDIARWNSDWNDCSSLAVSLNVQARRPFIVADKLPNVCICMTSPRLGFVDNLFSVVAACKVLDCDFIKSSGAFWGQCLERIMTETVRDRNPEYILTVDYDTLFTVEHVRALYRVAKRHDLDAVCPVQVKREEALSLLTIIGDDGKMVTELTPEVTTQDHMRITSGHFGLSLFKTDCLKRLPHPWFWGQPNADGEWGPGRTDDDIYFWKKWGEAGFKAYQANLVKVGHLQIVASWPDAAWKPYHQYMNDYIKGGPPPCAR